MSDAKRCPYCDEENGAVAIKCSKCGERLDAPVTPAPAAAAAKIDPPVAKAPPEVAAASAKEAVSEELDAQPAAAARFSMRFAALAAGALAVVIAIIVIAIAIAAKEEPTEWVSLPGGSFMMGSENGDDDEKPRHRVTLSAYDIARTETTVGQYAACVDAGKCSAATRNEGCNAGDAGRNDHPINCVDWGQAKAFCEWAGGQLPTEAQWEHAARSGGKEINYPWGNEEASCARAVMNDDGLGCGKSGTWAVCSKTQGNTGQGVCDLAGNVWEWVADRHDKDYYGNSETIDPPGPAGDYARVVRGGSWHSDDPGALRASNRFRVGPALQYRYLGFRCARAPRVGKSTRRQTDVSSPNYDTY